MKRPFLVSVVSLLVTAGLVCGQRLEAPASPEPASPEPAAPASPAPAVPSSMTPIVGNPPPCATCPGPPVGLTYFTADAEYILWLVQRERLGPSVVTSDPTL